jgi:uncharacterized cupredoxin-like copper-binding protein
MNGTGVRRVALGAYVAAVAAALGGCGLTDHGDNLVNGKTQFVAKCGSCHTMQRAGTTGVTGPNLDQSFQRARIDGFGQSTFSGMVHRQILDPARRPQYDPNTGKALPLMPAGLLKGDDAKDVAAYVASAVAKGGEDPGRLADVGAKKAEGTAEEKGGTLSIPADPGGALSYTFADAAAKAGKVTVESPNKSSTDHDIAVEGNGVNAKGPVVSNGGVSKFTVDLKPGEYTFFCTVPGHREGGMEGKLTVK